MSQLSSGSIMNFTILNPVVSSYKVNELVVWRLFLKLWIQKEQSFLLQCFSNIPWNGKSVNDTYGQSSHLYGQH